MSYFEDLEKTIRLQREARQARNQELYRQEQQQLLQPALQVATELMAPLTDSFSLSHAGQSGSFCYYTALKLPGAQRMFEVNILHGFDYGVLVQNDYGFTNTVLALDLQNRVQTTTEQLQTVALFFLLLQQRHKNMPPAAQSSLTPWREAIQQSLNCARNSPTLPSAPELLRLQAAQIIDRLAQSAVATENAVAAERSRKNGQALQSLMRTQKPEP